VHRVARTPEMLNTIIKGAPKDLLDCVAQVAFGSRFIEVVIVHRTTA
jgi:hypothetical protein